MLAPRVLRKAVVSSVRVRPRPSPAACKDGGRGGQSLDASTARASGDSPATTRGSAPAAHSPTFAITPAAPRILDPCASLPGPPSAARSIANDSWRTRGLYGAILALLALLCLCWTLWLMLLTAWPTSTVNHLMATSELDFGTFWRLSESSTSVVVAGLLGLAAVALGYVVVLCRIALDAVTAIIIITTRRRKKRFRTLSRNRSITAKVGADAASARRGSDPCLSADHHSSAGTLPRTASQLAIDVLDLESPTRRNMNALIKIADLVVQCVSLAQLLETGMPVALVVGFAAIVALNALSAAVMFVLPHDGVGHAQLLVDTAFDFVVAVVFPASVLVYALSSFTFDKALMAINAQVFPPGLFEHQASAAADPVEVAVVRRTLDSVRVDSVVKIFTRVGICGAFCRRVLGLGEVARARSKGHVGFPNVYPKRRRFLAALCLLVAVAVIVVTAGSIATSTAACRMHPECVQITYRWVSRADANDATRCPCLAMIDRDVAIATYDEWEMPIDRTEKLAQLAASGDLQTLQLVNRALPTFPEQLRRSLYYTDTVAVPDWFAELTKLEFLHIEGKSPLRAITHLPDRLFDGMHQLTYLHLAMHGFALLPPFDGLTSLQTLVLGGLFSLTELPRFDRLHKLERITIAAVFSVEAFPDLSTVQSLQSLVVVDRGAFCCNGFLGADRCNLTRSLCHQHPMGAPAVPQCLPSDRTASPATRAYFDKFSRSACAGEALGPSEIKFAPTREEMAPCNGTLFRACEAPGTPRGTPGMCYNTRWMAVSCDPSPFPIEMRRRQIALGRGAPCDPVDEAWLGCTSSRSRSKA